MKKEIEAKLELLKKNREVVTKNINDGQELVKKAIADLQAIAGAIQVCEQLLKSSEGEKPFTIALIIKIKSINVKLYELIKDQQNEYEMKTYKIQSSIKQMII